MFHNNYLHTFIVFVFNCCLLLMLLLDKSLFLCLNVRRRWQHTKKQKEEGKVLIYWIDDVINKYHWGIARNKNRWSDEQFAGHIALACCTTTTPR